MNVRGAGAVRRVGHKGADALLAGNTVASFARAVEVGVDVIELDVLRLAGGEPLVVAHDAHDAAARPRLTLAEALDAFGEPPLERVELNCDLKLPGGEAELVAALGERGLIERAMVSTMYVESLRTLAALEPRLRRGWTYPLVTRAWDRSVLARPLLGAALAVLRRRLPQRARRRVPELGLSSIWAYHRLVGPRAVAAAAELGVDLYAWTVDDPERIAELRALGVGGIVSNDPRLLQHGGG